MRPAGTTTLFLAFAFVIASAPVLRAQDLSVYRQFRIGMTAAAATAQIGVPETTAKIIHTRPLLIQELEWAPPGSLSPLEPDSVQLVLLDFCNGELFRIVVRYRGERVEGLTEQDVVAAISTAYGQPTRPAARIIISDLSKNWTNTEQVIARWEDASVSVNLFRVSFPSSFGLVIFSKRAAPLARAAIDKAILVERADAPRRDAAEKKTRDDVEAGTHAKARLANKAAFKF
jgi:hypothetical protein